MKDKVFYFEFKGKFLEAEISVMPAWDEFDKLINFLKENYAAKVIDAFDGLGTRRWTLESKGVKYQLLHDDFFGNSLCAIDAKSEALVRLISDHLKGKFKNI